MDNNEAFTFLKDNDSENLSSQTRKFVTQCSIQEKYFDQYRLKFVALLKKHLSLES